MNGSGFKSHDGMVERHTKASLCLIFQTDRVMLANWQSTFQQIQTEKPCMGRFISFRIRKLKSGCRNCLGSAAILDHIGYGFWKLSRPECAAVELSKVFANCRDGLGGHEENDRHIGDQHEA